MGDNCMHNIRKKCMRRTAVSAIFYKFALKFRLLLGVNEKLLTQHISGPVTKYKLL